jgi:SAM-dependent methyltransferase
MNMNEFEAGDNQWLTKFVCLKYEFRKVLASAAKSILFRKKKTTSSFTVKSRYTVSEAKKIIRNEGLALNGYQPSWFYTSFERLNTDPLTNCCLQFIEDNVPKESSILITGCGTGIMVFHLADAGFKSIEGRDLLQKCIRVASRLKEQFNYSNTSFLIDDGLQPKLDNKYDLITALHWVFSAWMGNYGNTAQEDPRNPIVRERLLVELLRAYSINLNKDGIIIIELIDAVTDYREPFDHPLGLKSLDIYPVRHTPEQVSKCANLVGLKVIDKKLVVSYGHHPRTGYFLKKV